MVADLDEVFREEWGQVLAAMLRFLGDMDLAEDATQEAFAIAAYRWPRDGTPANPRAWLRATARNRAIDRARREQRFAARVALLAADPADSGVGDAGRAGGASGADGPGGRDDPGGLDGSGHLPDERLELIVLCCHPALGREAQVALTLREVVGLTTARIARAFLVPEATMAQRLVRAKRRLRDVRASFELPEGDELAARFDAVLAVVWLVFDEGWSSPSDLAAEALWLGTALARLAPHDPEVRGLLAMMLVHDSRRDARRVDGRLVLLPDQDRDTWDHEQLRRGRAELDAALALGGSGPYVLQAAIAVAHAEPEPDWRHLAVLYGELARRQPSPVVELNRAMAVAEVEGPAEGWRLVDRLPLDGYQWFHAARAELLDRLGRSEEAAAEHRRALELADAEPERRFHDAALVRLDAR